MNKSNPHLVKLEVFEGPMELLMHLIHKNEIDIYDIPISLLTEQFMAYIDQMNLYNMDNISEFLVMAATLLEIKSKMLLPKPPKDDDGENLDPRIELLKMIMEYQELKKIATIFSEKAKNAGQPFYKTSELSLIKNWNKLKTTEAADVLQGVNFVDIQTIFLEVLKRKELKVDHVRSGFGEIDEEVFTVEEKMDVLLDLIKETGNIEFKNAFKKDATKEEVVTTFCAVLELIKLQKIFITQEDNFANIFIEMK